MPNLIGKSLPEAVKLAINAGFNVRLTGNTEAAHDGEDTVVEQSLPPGEKAKKGTILSFKAITTKFED